MNRIAEKEDKLFEDWPSRQESFIRDGLVDADEYARSPVKLVFVLKEANAPDEKSGDLREFLRRGDWGPTWNNVTRWVEGIEGLPHIVPWDELSLSRGDNNRRKRALRKIAAVNLKKEPGAGVAKYEQLREATRRDRQSISKQLSFSAPNYVICCGTDVSNLLFEAEPIGVYPRNADDWKRTRRGVRYRIENGVPHIAYLHPQARMPGYLLHYGLIDAVVELEKIYRRV